MASSSAAPNITPDCVAPCPPGQYTLDYSSTQNVWEPQGNVPGNGGACVNDAGGHCYIDGYMWYMCGEGATAATLYYWGKPTFSYSNGAWFSDPHTSTYWNNSYARAYMMYLATQSNPPSFGTSPGELHYHAYPFAETHIPDLRDVLNWEASGHNTGNWSSYFYAALWYNTFNQSQLFSDVRQDLWYSGVPAVVVLNAQKLPNWKDNGSVTSHAIAIIGYDAYNFTYIDTCGYGCSNNGYSNGVYTASQSTVYNAIQGDNSTGALIW
jgi:hypothetical protein